MRPHPNTDIVPTVEGLAYGGDYNPEQWPREVWDEDLRLMREAGVNTVSVNIFAWAGINPAEGVWDFERLDAIMHLLHDGGVKADLATSTASPPPWFSQAHPETLPVDADGRRLNSGARAEYCPHAPVFQAAAVEMASRLADRYAEHPALAMWHVGNEYYRSCFCDYGAAAFRAWLQDRYSTLDGLNEAWGTTFWSQTFTHWSQVLPPRISAETPNPGLVLDWQRFGSDALLERFRAEADAIAERSDKPITTNLMVTGDFSWLDYHRWGPHVTGPGRLVATDHYLIPEHDSDIEWPAQVAFGADASRGLAGGSPWLLMEQSTNSSAWRRGYFAKKPGDLVRHSLSYVARGSEGAMFFQWRASRYGAERYHSAMLPHGGADSKVFREVKRLGAHLARLGEVKGSTTVAKAAVLLDFESAWAAKTPGQPSADMTTYPEIRRWHAELWRHGVTADLANPAWDLTAYDHVFAPHLYALDSDANLRAYVEQGGTLVIGPYSGVVDRNEHVHPNLPGAIRDLIGVRVEEFCPLPEGAVIGLDDGTEGRTWSEAAHALDAEVVASFTEYPATGAVFRRRLGEGEVWYLATRPTDLAPVLRRVGLRPDFPGTPQDLELVRRRHEDGRSYLFAINHGTEPATIPAEGRDLLTEADWTSETELAAGETAVIREA